METGEATKKKRSAYLRRRSVGVAPIGVDNYKFPPRFRLLDKDFYVRWCRHRREVLQARPIVSATPPPLFPELYLKPRRLNEYAHRFQDNINVNKDMLKAINIIQKTGNTSIPITDHLELLGIDLSSKLNFGSYIASKAKIAAKKLGILFKGFVDCWRKKSDTRKNNVVHTSLCKPRQDRLDQIYKQNMELFQRIQNARSQHLQTKELEEEWKRTKRKLILGASLPFILFKHDTIDKNIRDPAFIKSPNAHRVTVMMEVWVEQGAKIGRVIIELFNEIVPQTCQMFMTLVKGDSEGRAYTGTRFFTIVPGLYCRGGDLEKDNGFGNYLMPESYSEYPAPENFDLKHSVPGVLSMVVSSDNEVYGQFNIIFKPLPQFDGKHVVFGRIVSGPPAFLERISALGLPLGTTSAPCRITRCGFFSPRGHYHEGMAHTKLPKRERRSVTLT